MEKRIIVGVTVVVVAPLLYLGFKKLISVWRSSDRSTSSPQEIHNIDIEYDSLIATLKERAQEFAAKGEIDKAIVVVKDCIEESLKKEGKSTFDPCAVVELQTWLAELFLQQKPTADETSAIDTLTKALQLLNAHNENGKLNGKIANVYHRLGTIYFQIQKWKDAFNCFTEVATIWETERNHNLLGLYQLYKTMGEIQEKLGFFKRAQELFEKSLQVLKEIYQGQDRPEMASVIFNIAQQLLKQGAYDQALQQCSNAVNLFKKEYGEVSHQVISCLTLNAAIHKHKRDIKNMERTFDEIFALQQQLYKEKLATKDTTAITTISMTQHQAALYFLEMKRMDKVLAYCQKALNFLLENGIENTFTHASILHTMSVACSGLQNIQDAKEYAEKELQIMQKLYPEGSQELAPTYANLITIYLRLRDKVSATVLIEKEMNILKKVYGENHLHVQRKRQHYNNILSQLSNRSGSVGESGNISSPTTTSGSHSASGQSPKRARTLSVPLPKYQQ